MATTGCSNGTASIPTAPSTSSTTICATPIWPRRKRARRKTTDLQAFIDAIDPAIPFATRQIVAYDQINLAAMVNYLVARQINSDMDHAHKNYYLYRDTNRTREWQPIIWDVDLSWGHDWTEARLLQ
jgi:hypothetical protein